MTQDDFYAAKVMEKDGWEFVYESEGYMVFTRLIGGLTFSAKVAMDR